MRTKTKALARRAALAALVVVALAAGLAACATPAIEIGSPDLSRAADGAYEGYYDGGMVKAKVRVTLAAGRIESVAILQHDCGKGKPAEAIVDDVVAAQGLDVDAVAGATYSSKVILKAIEIAIESAIR